MSDTTIDFEKLKGDILIEHNRLRAEPRCYIPLVEAQMKLLKEKILYRVNETPIETNEGSSAYEEAIEFLRKQKPIETLIYDERLSSACKDHVLDIGSKGIVSHESSDGKGGVTERIEQYCEWEVCCAENLDFGTRTGKDVILSLLIDDGVKDRGHRANLFKQDVKYIGIHSGIHREYETVTVINYVGGIREKGKPFFDPKTYKYEFPKEIGTALDEDVTEKTEKKAKKAKTSFQLQDEDAPDNTACVRTFKNVALYEGKVRRTTKKVYTLDNGKQHIVEVEDY